MNSHIFLCSERISHERLAWITEILKFYYVRAHPESLHHRPMGRVPSFVFFLTGDALYSLVDKQCSHLWNVLFSFSQFSCVVDLDEVRLRGISLVQLSMKNPFQFIAVDPVVRLPRHPFWERYLDAARGIPESEPGSVGFLQLESPYMNRSPLYTARLLRTAVELGYSPELYACLDGVHLGHSHQAPAESENIGTLLSEISQRAAEKNLACHYVCSSRSASARGYITMDDGRGNFLSSCIIPRFIIRNPDRIIDRFEQDHIIISHCCFMISSREYQVVEPEIRKRKQASVPALIILVTHTPYGTERVSGALSFATASAFRGIKTRVIFLEEGIYSLTGTHTVPEGEMVFSMQDLIHAASETNNLELYAHLPSLQMRGMIKQGTKDGVFVIGSQELARLVLVPPGGSTTQQRVLVF